MFDEILQRIGHRIEKMLINFRDTLEPDLKLAIMIRCLASGDKYSTLQYDFRVSRLTIIQNILGVCQAIASGSVFTKHLQEYSLSLSLPYGLANQKLCYIQMLLNIEKIWRTRLRMSLT